MLRIGNTEFRHGLILAPLAGVTDTYFRRICKSFGAELVCSEMVSSEGVKRRMARSMEYLNFCDEERPISIQIFGSSPESMKEAAKIIETDFHPDVIDINLGCPVKKVIKTGAGAALLKDTKKMEDVVNSVVSSVNTPVSAKIRVGWDKDNSLEISKVLEGCGICFLTVHARRACDNYSVKADWSVYKDIMNNISIPIVANGDITRPEDVMYLRDDMGVDAVMIGRGALGRPWIFKMIKDLIENGRLREEPFMNEKIEVFLKQIELMKENIGKERTVGRLKKHVVYYLKGFTTSKDIIHEILISKKLEEIISLISNIIVEQ